MAAGWCDADGVGGSDVSLIATALPCATSLAATPASTTILTCWCSRALRMVLSLAHNVSHSRAEGSSPRTVAPPVCISMGASSVMKNVFPSLIW